MFFLSEIVVLFFFLLCDSWDIFFFFVVEVMVDLIWGVFVLFGGRGKVGIMFNEELDFLCFFLFVWGGDWIVWNVFVFFFFIGCGLGGILRGLFLGDRFVFFYILWFMVGCFLIVFIVLMGMLFFFVFFGYIIWVVREFDICILCFIFNGEKWFFEGEIFNFVMELYLMDFFVDLGDDLFGIGW